MSGWNGELSRLLASGDPLAIVYYDTAAERDDLLELAALLLPSDRTLVRVNSLDALFDAQNLDKVVAIEFPHPGAEHAAVLALEAVRDRLLARRSPGLLFLLAGGAASGALREVPSLASWLRGREFNPRTVEYDPEEGREENLEQAQRRFRGRLGCTPEEWLRDWRDRKLEHSTTNELLAIEADRLTGGEQ